MGVPVGPALQGAKVWPMWQFHESVPALRSKLKRQAAGAVVRRICSARRMSRIVRLGYDGDPAIERDVRSGAGGRDNREMELLRLNNTLKRDPAIDAWMQRQKGELGAIAHEWFEVMRGCGDEVREILHDGCPVACLGDAPFGYVNVFTAHVNVGFFRGASLKDPAGLLQGDGKRMRHVKLRPGTATDAVALRRLIELAYADMKACVENG